MADSGFDIVEHRVKQITNSFTESRHLLAEIEDDLHASGQLRRGESDKISEVDSELLRSSSSIQGGWERVSRLRSKAFIASNDPILFVLDKTFNEVESRLYNVLLDAHSNQGFLDYGSLIVTSQRESQPLIEALKGLANRLRQAVGIPGAEITPPTSANDRTEPKSKTPSRGVRGVPDSSTALGSFRRDIHGSSNTSYSPQTRKGSSLTTSSHGGSGYDSDSYRSDSDTFDIQFKRDHTSISSQSSGFNSRSGQSSWSLPDSHDRGSRHKPPPLFSNKSRNQSESSQPRVVSSIQEELPDLNIGSLTLSPTQLRPMVFDSRNNSTSDDGGHQSQIYGSSWKSSSIATPDTVPSPVSPAGPQYQHNEVTYQSNVGKVREVSSRNQPQGIRNDRAKRHESSEAVSPHSQPRKRYPAHSIDSFGPPPAPPPVGKLPEPPRPVKVSLFPTNNRRDMSQATADSSSSIITQFPEPGKDIRPTKPIPIAPSGQSTRLQGYNATPPEHGFPSRINTGSHGLNYDGQAAKPATARPLNINRDSEIPSEALAHPGTLVNFGPPAPKSAPLPSTRPNLSKPIPTSFSVVQQAVQDASPVRPRTSEKQQALSSTSEIMLPPSRPSLAQTTSSEGTITPEKWRCLTQTVKQIPGLASPPIELVPSLSPSTRPADNLPNELNKYWTLCKNAVTMQIGESKKTPEEVAVRPTGLTGNEKYMKCRKCKYEYSAFANLLGKGRAVTDPRLKEGPRGIMYKETILFKSHVTTKKDKLPQEEYHFGCIFCAANGNGMPIYKGKTSFLTHLADHGNGNYPNEILKTRIKFITRREYDPNTQDTSFELVLP